ncbi:beclin 1 [Musa troglodytarum]|uniref:Beclin 1 n=1 Tax=Musa troglodytarum TaxID=320322 RepID=A0A9E7KH06_9LILI|nr:beclin 1 [Musa troglodytarum]
MENLELLTTFDLAVFLRYRYATPGLVRLVDFTVIKKLREAENRGGGLVCARRCLREGSFACIECSPGLLAARVCRRLLSLPLPAVVSLAGES